MMIDIDAELQHARLCQTEGNWGRTRVYARRAAGQALRGWGNQPGDALRQLRQFAADDRVPLPLREAAIRLTTKVDEDHRLPFGIDPITDAEAIVRFTRG